MAAMMNMNNLLNGKDSRWLQLEVCREFQRNKCSRQDTECKFAHPPANVEVQNGKVTACYDSIKGRCNREKPPCKYFHPPQHLKDQLLINGRNHLALKNALMQQMAITSGQPVMPGQVPAVNGTTSVPPLGFSVTVGSQPIMATNPYLTGIPASTYSPYFAPGHLVPALLGPDPSAVASQLGPVVPQAVPVAQQKIARSDRLEMDMKTAFSGMVPYKRPAAEKSGIPVYQPGATTYQQLMQLQQPFVPVSCEYPSPSPSATTAIPQPQSSTTANPIANNNKNQINLNNNSNSNGVVVSNRTLLSSLSSNISNSTLSSSNGIVVTSASLQNSIQQNHLINIKNNVNNNCNNNRSITGNNANNANNDNNNNINTNNNNNINNILNNANNNSSTNNNNTIPNGAVPPKGDSNSNNGIINNTASVSNNPTPPGNNNFNNVNTTPLAVTTTASTPPTTTSDDVNVKTDANNAAEVVVPSQPLQQSQSTQHLQTNHMLNNHHGNNTNYNQIHSTPTHHYALHNQHQAQALQNHLHHTASQNSLNASLLSYPSHSNAITVPHPSIQMAAGHHQAYYPDPAAIAKEVAQKNYANALKMAAVSGSIAIKPMSALTYTGVALNKAMVPQHPGTAAAVAAAAATNHHSAAVANRMASPLAGVVNNVPQSTPSFMTRPPPGFMQASLIRQHVGLTPSGAPTAATAQNPYAAGTAAVGNAQFLNHQNFFYPGLVAGYPFGMGASGASGLGGHAVPQTVPANLAAASMSAMQGVQQVGTAAGTPGSAVVLNPYKKMKTS